MNLVKPIIPILAIVGILCSCATVKPPDAVNLNAGAGRGDWLWQTLRLEDGTELLFVVDTGAPLTYLDKSLEPRLGKPIGEHVAYGYYETLDGHEYRSPKLFLGNTQLRTGPEVRTVNLKWVSDAMNCRTDSNRHLSGILGMDCLRHYCIQLDFVSGKMRFLDRGRLHTQALGTAFPLRFLPQRSCPFISENLLGMHGEMTEIDTGCNNDGQLNMKWFERTTNRWVAYSSTNTPSFTNTIEVRFPSSVFAGETYPDLHITGNNEDNTIGLRFLARHLVTFDFPKRKMYLKRVSVGPLAE